MNSIFKKIIRKLRATLIPTAQDKEFNRWLSDGGDERLRFDYDLTSDSLAIDLGGYKGQWCSDIYARYNCRVLVFEPVNSFAEKILERFKKNRKIEVYCLALGASRRRELIGLSADGTSVYRSSSVKEWIQFEDVAEFFDKHNIKAVDLIKINIEGGEYELLPRLLETGLIDRIKYIQIQFHNVGTESESLMENIRNELSKTHNPVYQYKFVWENWVRRDA